MTTRTPATKGKARLAKTTGGAAIGLLAVVAAFEGLSLMPYRDVVGIKTVCYGETRVAMRTYTKAECDEMLADGLADFAEGVLKRNPELRGHDPQLLAATSLAYNIGTGAYSRSTAARNFSRGKWRSACNAMLLWNRAGGRVVPGLAKRREKERAICLRDIPAQFNS